MPVIFTRIDDRLLHGQVVQGWIPYLKATEVVVVSDEVASDDIRKSLMRISLQEDVGLNIFSVADAADYLKKAAASSERMLVLAAGPGELVKLAGDGVPFETINVGGMHYSMGKAQIGRALFMGDDDKAALKKLASLGIKLEGRGVPNDNQEDILRALEN
jgi:mannose/fructose/N-acetylgalactosamine-specific phosphotransferase system component IIB